MNKNVPEELTSLLAEFVGNRHHHLNDNDALEISPQEMLTELRSENQNLVEGLKYPTSGNALVGLLPAVNLVGNAVLK